MLACACAGPARLAAAEETGQTPTTLALRASYQGCNEPHGVCYPPIEKVFDVELPAGLQP